MLHAILDQPEAARSCLGAGAEILRRLDRPLELGTLLGRWALAAVRLGDRRAARSALSEAEQLLDELEEGPRLELERRLAQARDAVRG